jgi:hypothetical protein
MECSMGSRMNEPIVISWKPCFLAAPDESLTARKNRRIGEQWLGLQHEESVNNA